MGPTHNPNVTLKIIEATTTNHGEDTEQTNGAGITRDIVEHTTEETEVPTGVHKETINLTTKVTEPPGPTTSNITTKM